MNQDQINTVNREVYRRFPELKDKKPKISLQEVSKSRSIAKAPTYLLIYQGQVVVSGQKKLPRLVRVVADEQGKILKISTSR